MDAAQQQIMRCIQSNSPREAAERIFLWFVLPWHERAMSAERDLAGTTKRIRDRVTAQIREQMYRNQPAEAAAIEGHAQQRLARYSDNLVKLLVTEYNATPQQARRAAERVQYQSWVEAADAEPKPIQVVNAGSPGLGKRR